MKYKTLLWSGCSHSFGSGMLGSSTADDMRNEPVVWNHPKLYDDFPNVVTTADAMKAIEERAYPHQIGKKLGFENIYNFSIPGTGIEPQLRKVTSFIVNNEDTIDFTKAVFCYQIPVFNRTEILDMRDSDSTIKFAHFNFQNIEDVDNGDDFSKNYYLNHFDFDYYMAKFLMYLYEYKGFIESKGMVFLPFQFMGQDTVTKLYDIVYPYIKPEEYMTSGNAMNISRSWQHMDVNFPNRKTLVKKIQHWDVIFNQPEPVNTLIGEGYNDDYHWSPKGHDAIANNLAPKLKEKLGI